MIPSVESLLDCLPPDANQWVTIKEDQSVFDIMKEIPEAHKKFAPYYDQIALYFDGDSTAEICKNIYNFLKSNIRYHEEGEKDQTTALPTGILTRRYGDCKHYASFAGGVLDALNRLNDTNIDWCYRFASYKLLDRVPHHVYVSVYDEDRGEEIWIDPTPGAKNQVPVWLIDKKIKVKPMALRRQIAGFKNIGMVQQIEYVEALPVDESQELAPAVVEQFQETAAATEPTPELQQAIETLLHYEVMNAAGEINDAQVSKLAASLPQAEFDRVADARQVIQLAIADAISNVQTNEQFDAAIGSFLSTLWNGVKKVTIAPARNAYLALVDINAFGYATKLYNAIYKEDGTYWQPGQEQLYKKWVGLGGTWTNLRNAIKRGHGKKAILGCIDCDDANVIGVVPAIPAWVAAASAIIAAITPLVKSILASRQQALQMNTGIDPNTGLSYNMNQPGAGGSGDIMQWVKDHPIETAAGAIGVYYLLTSTGKKVNAVRTRGMNKKTVGLLILGGAGLYLYFKNKNAGDTTIVENTGGSNVTPAGDPILPGATTDATTPTTPTRTGFLLVRDLLPYYSTSFDANAYLARYPDIRADSYYSQNPLEHWQKFGQYEGRIPSADPANVRYDSAFDAVYYLDRYPDIYQHFGSDYAKAYNHWLQYGMKEGRKPGGAYLINQ